MTENQRTLFGFPGKNELWDEMLKVIEQTQESLWLHAISSQVHGEDRTHACGQADGANMILSLFISLRNEAKALNGLTSDDTLA
jgi:hypothetical protein